MSAEPQECEHVWFNRIRGRGTKVTFDIVCRKCKAIGKEEPRG